MQVGRQGSKGLASRGVPSKSVFGFVSKIYIVRNHGGKYLLANANDHGTSCSIRVSRCFRCRTRICWKASRAIFSMSGCTFSESGRRLGKRGREGLPGTTTSVSRAERRSQMNIGLSHVVAGGAGGGGRRAVVSVFCFNMHEARS